MCPIRILVVDDHEVVRRRLCSLLQSKPSFEIVGEAFDGIEGVSQSKNLQPDVVILDISMPRLSGLEAAPKIRQVAPEAEILFVSQLDSPSVIREALSTGARGYVLKSDAAIDLVDAVLAVSQKRTFVSGRLHHSVAVPRCPNVG